jgi:hypothetical protein
MGEQVDFKTASLHVRRLKNGTPSTHPLIGREFGHSGGTRIFNSPALSHRRLDLATCPP